jgi:hypothetical protein
MFQNFHDIIYSKGERIKKVEIASRYVRFHRSWKFEVEVSVTSFLKDRKLAPRYAPALGGVYSVTEIEVKPCEMREAYFTGEIEIAF